MIGKVKVFKLLFIKKIVMANCGKIFFQTE